MVWRGSEHLMSLFEVKNYDNNKVNLESRIKLDEITDRISNAFDYSFDGVIKTTIEIPKFPTDFQIGLIIGSSGSGKSTLLKQFGEVERHDWDNNLCIASHFDNFEEASKNLVQLV